MFPTASRRHPLRARLGVAFAVAAIVPAALVLALYVGAAARHARLDAGAAITRAATLLHGRVDAHLAHQTRNLAGAADVLARPPLRPVAGQPVPADLAGWLERQAASLPDFEGLFVTDAAGVVAAATSSTTVDAVAQQPRSVTDGEYLREPMRRGEPFLSGLLVGPDSQSQVLLLAVPIPDRSGRPAGVIGGALRLSAFDALLRDAGSPDSHLQVLDPSGFQVASSDARAGAPRSPARAQAVTPLLAGSHPTDGTPFWYETRDGEMRLAAVLLSPRGWRTAVTLGHGAVYAPAWQSAGTALLVAAAGLLLAAAMMLLLAGRAMRPLQQFLADAASAESDAPPPAAATAPEEVARLAADFARMSARATAVRATLEQQVTARTIELSEARDRAEREARLKGVFLAAMSHEIRTPMNSIVGMAELMAETPLDSEQREYCDTIRTSTDALLGVINDILDFSKIESQGVSLEEIDFDLRLVVEDAVELLAVKAASAGLDLAAVVEPGFDGRFRGDPSRLRQVVVNLLGNAVKFTTHGGVVVRVSTAAGDAAHSRVRIEVIDTGIGMSPEGLARLFRPFAQADETTARQFGGTGLGLTISKQIVERMGGEIVVESAPGRGSTFRVDLPLPRTAALAPAPALARPVTTALVLEPRDHSAEALVRLLTDLGVHATRVASAGDGLGALDARPTGFAVAFVSVDAVDAAPFVDALRQHALAAHTSLVALVPVGRRSDAGLERFATAHRVTRPVRRARLVECLDTVSAGRPSDAGQDHFGPVAHAASVAGSAPCGPSLPASVPGAVSAAAGGPRVLVADDYFANQRLVTRLLERRGYVVEAVSDGQAAVDAVRDRHFDVVLMDCNMPIMDGYAATAQIRALDGDRRVPILAMTANDSAEDRDTCLRAGMDDYLVKPIQAAIVLAALERWAAPGRRPAATAPAGPSGGSR